MSKIKFLITLGSAIRNGAVKTIKQAVAFAEQQFGKIDKSFVDDIVNVFKKEGKVKKKGDVVPIKKKKEGIKTLSEADQDIADIQKSIDELDAAEAEADAFSILDDRTRDIAKGDVEEVVDLETTAKKIKEAAEALKKSTIKPEGIMESIVKGQRAMRDLHREGQVRTAVRWFMRQESDAGRLKLRKWDQDALEVYGQTTESDPINIFRRYYGEDALDAADGIADVFEKGESFNHYAELLRKNVDSSILTPKTSGLGQYDESVVAAEKIRKAKEQEAKNLKILEEFKPDREPSAYGGIAGMLGERTGYFEGALADTEEGKSMSPGTRHDYTRGQGHRETADARDLAEINKFHNMKAASMELKPPKTTIREKIGGGINRVLGNPLVRSYAAWGTGGLSEKMRQAIILKNLYENRNILSDEAAEEEISNIPVLGGISPQFAGGGLAPMLGEPTYEDGGRVPLGKGKFVLSKLDEGIAYLKKKFGKDIIKKGELSKPMASKTELKRAIAGFQERQNITKELESFRGQIDDNIIKEISAMEPAQQLKAIEEVKLYIRNRKNLKQDLMLQDFDVTSRKPNATGGRVSLSAGGVAGMLGE